MKKFLTFIKEDIWAYILLAFGFLLRVFYIFLFTTPEKYLFSDPGYYDQRALQMAKDQYIMFSTYWPPFFHMFLSIIYRPLVWLGLENWRIKIDIIIFALLYIVAFWCIYQIAKKLFTKKIALIILAVLIFWYPFIFFNYLIMSENLFFPLLFLGLYFLIVKPIKHSTGLWLGLFWGFAFLTRPVFALAIPLFLLWALYYKINWKFLLAFSTTGIIIIALMMGFNFCYTKNDTAGGTEKSISSNGGVGFAMLWCDAKSIQFDKNGYNFGFGPPANIDYKDSKRIFTSVPFSNQKFYYQMGLDCFKKNPERIIKNLSSVWKLFHSHLFPTIGNIAFWENFRIIFKILTDFLFAGALLSFIAITMGLFKVEEPIKKYFLLFALIIFSLLATVYFQNVGEERYLIPYAPLLMILIIPLINFLIERKYIQSYAVALIFASVISLALRLSLFDFQSGDYTGFLQPWINFIKSHGIMSFKYNFSDHTPLYTYFLGILAVFPIPALYAIKILSIMFDFALAFFVFLIVKKKYKKNNLIPALSFITVLFAPTILLNSAYWGQNDVIYTCFLVASVYFLIENKHLASLILYGIAFSLKLQAIFLLPLFAILFLKNRIKFSYFLAVPLVYFATLIPAGLIGRPFKDLLLIYWQQSKNYNFLTLNAPSFYQWISQNQFDLFYPIGILLAIAIILIFILAGSQIIKKIKENQIIKIALLSVALIPFLLPKMHERYFFPADVFSIIFAFYFPKFFFLPVAMQIASFLSYGPFLWGKHPNFPLLSLAVLAIIAIVAYDLFKNSKKESYE